MCEANRHSLEEEHCVQKELHEDLEKGKESGLVE